MGRLWAIFFLFAMQSQAQGPAWQLGGSGSAWSRSDSLQVLIDFDSIPKSIQPFYLEPEQNVLHLLENWQFWRVPSDYDLGYEDGQKPRFWNRWSGAGGDPTQSGIFLVDADSTTYNAPKVVNIANTFFTIDTAVPIPAYRFGFYTPDEGYRSDGTPLRTDVIPAFDASIGDDEEPAVNWGGNDLFQRVVANVGTNFESDVRIDFSRQYARFFRWRRRESPVDAEALNRCSGCGGQGNQAIPLKGTIGGFDLFAHGVPQRAFYLSKVVDLGRIVNFGHLHWHATPMRRVNGLAVEDPTADVWLTAEVRVGRDDDPAVYHEYTNTGREKEVSRATYESLSAVLGRDPRPGIRASIGYDTDNWSFWSVPFTETGQLVRLRSGSHLQIKLTLESRDFDAWIRIDSLWIETPPLLVDEVIGEIARLDDLQPQHGFTEVELGRDTEFAYDLRAEFTTASAPGFDALRIYTGSRADFVRLEMGAPLAVVEPAAVAQEEGALVVQLPESVTRRSNAPVRVVFSTRLFEFASTFEGEVFTSNSDALPQPILPGDASEAIATNSLRVLSAEGGSVDFVRDLQRSTGVLTPNGDGVNDGLTLRYALFRLPGPVPVRLEVYTLDGHRIALIEGGLQDAGPRQLVWDGRDENGRLLPAGLYLFSIALDTQAAQKRALYSLGIAY